MSPRMLTPFVLGLLSALLLVACRGNTVSHRKLVEVIVPSQDNPYFQAEAAGSLPMSLITMTRGRPVKSSMCVGERVWPAREQCKFSPYPPRNKTIKRTQRAFLIVIVPPDNFLTSGIPTPGKPLVPDLRGIA